MLIFSIESSCDETSCAVVEMSDTERKIHSNVVFSQIDTHALYGGVVPEIASRAHIEKISSVAKEAFSKSGFTPKDMDAIAVTYSPGLIGPLLVGVNFAKALASSIGVPLVPVDHIKGHTAAAYLSHPELKAPFLALVVSGGHTSVYKVDSPCSFVEIASTRDDAAGEAFDKVGRVMGLPYPGGAAMDRLATEGFENIKNGYKSALKFPSPAIPGDTLDFSFSGLKTYAVNAVHTERQKLGLDDKAPLSEEFRAGVAAGFTEAVVTGICAKLEKIIKEGDVKRLVLAGGVAANSHLRRGISSLAEKYGISLSVPPLSLCGDNAAMIGAQGYFEYMGGTRADSSLNAFASEDAAYDARAKGTDGIKTGPYHGEN